MSEHVATDARTLTASAVRVRVPFRHAFVTAAGTWEARDAWILRLRDGEGRTGFGEAALHPGADAAAHDALAAGMRDLVDAIDRGVAPEALLGGIAAPLQAALDAALVGAGPATLEPALTAGSAGIPVNATIGWGSGAEMAAEASAAVRTGFTTLKLKGAGIAEDVVERIAAVRGAVGADVRLRLDMNGAWTVRAAEAALRDLVPLDIEYVEDPLVPGTRLAAIADLRHATGVPIALDETTVDPADARLAIDAGAADVLVAKPARVGGIRATLDLAELALARGVDVVVSSLLETGVGLAAGVAAAALIDRSAGMPGRAHGLATADLLATDLLAEPLVVREGHLAVRDLTALTLDEDAVAAHTVASAGASW